MELDLILLLITTTAKAAILALIGGYLLKKWDGQERKYYSDFPFLMAITFFIFALTKVYDLWLYSHFSENPSILSAANPESLLLGKVRFLLVVFCVAPYFYLMQQIWFGEKTKIQVCISAIWVIASVVSVLTATSYSAFLLTISIAAFPPIFLSVITFAIIHHQRRLPEINSLLLAIGWSGYIITQLIRPIWASIGSGAFGLSWLGELVELFTMIIVGLGFLKHAIYYNVDPEDDDDGCIPVQVMDIPSKINEEENLEISIELS